MSLEVLSRLFMFQVVNINDQKEGRNWRSFRAFPGRPWRRTQDSVGYKTDDKRERKKKSGEKGKISEEKENRRKRERKMDGNKREEIQKCS